MFQLQMNTKGARSAAVLALMFGIAVSSASFAGNKKLMTINAAKKIAQRAIVESVIGLKVRSDERVQDMIAEHVKVEAKTAAQIKGIEFTDVLYDPAKDIAKVTAQIKVGQVTNIVGRHIDYGSQVVKRVGFATSTPAMAGPLQAMRAAELDAYKNLAQSIVGLRIESGSTVENYILSSDEVRAKTMAAIYGAELTSYHWDEAGDAYVKLALKTEDVQDILGQRLDYQGELIEAEGAGAQADDFTQARHGTEPTRGSSSIREGAIDVPVTAAGHRMGEGQPTGFAPERDPDAGGAVNLLND